MKMLHFPGSIGFERDLPISTVIYRTKTILKMVNIQSLFLFYVNFINSLFYRKIISYIQNFWN